MWERFFEMLCWWKTSSRWISSNHKSVGGGSEKMVFRVQTKLFQLCTMFGSHHLCQPPSVTTVYYPGYLSWWEGACYLIYPSFFLQIAKTFQQSFKNMSLKTGFDTYSTAYWLNIFQSIIIIIMLVFRLVSLLCVITWKGLHALIFTCFFSLWNSLI